MIRVVIALMMDLFIMPATQLTILVLFPSAILCIVRLNLLSAPVMLSTVSMILSVTPANLLPAPVALFIRTIMEMKLEMEIEIEMAMIIVIVMEMRME